MMLHLTGLFILTFLTINANANGYAGRRNTVASSDYAGGGTTSTQLQEGRLQEVFGWKQIDFQYPTPQARQQAISSGAFVASNVVPVGVAAANFRVFISMPRWFNGVPATLATVPFPSDSSSPALRPYPSWEWSRQGNCEGITSVFRVKIDECNRLWVLDTGVVNSFVNGQQICPPQVIVFDLKNDKMVFRYRFPNSTLKQDSLLVSMEVEYPRRQCDLTDAVLYVADVTTYALIVVDLSAGRAWRIQDKTMYPTPEAGTFTLNGESFELMDGVLGLALSPRQNQAQRTLYYHAMSGFKQRWVPTSFIRNQTASNSNPRAFQTGPYVRKSQAAGCGMDENGVLFFGLVVSNTLACWNTRKPFTASNLVPLMRDDRTMQFFTTVTVDPDSRLWAVSNRLQSYILRTLNPAEVNFRIFLAPSTRALVRGTACERGGQGTGHQSSSSIDPTNQLVFRP